jgi:hypothetical protein
LFSFDGETGEAESSVFFMDCSGLSVVLTSPDSAFCSVFLKRINFHQNMKELLN